MLWVGEGGGKGLPRCCPSPRAVRRARLNQLQTDANSDQGALQLAGDESRMHSVGEEHACTYRFTEHLEVGRFLLCLESLLSGLRHLLQESKCGGGDPKKSSACHIHNHSDTVLLIVITTKCPYMWLPCFGNFGPLAVCAPHPSSQAHNPPTRVLPPIDVRF